MRLSNLSSRLLHDLVLRHFGSSLVQASVGSGSMACCDGSNDQGNRNQKKKYQKEKYDPLRRVNHGMTQTVDYVSTVLTDTSLMAIVSALHNFGLSITSGLCGSVR